MSDILRDLVEPAELVAIRVGGESVQFKVEKGLTIGRRQLFARRNQAEIALEYPFLAHTQGRLAHYLGEWHYKNLTNANTTSINGVALPKGEDRLLQNGDIIRVQKAGEQLILVFLLRFDGELVWKKLPLRKEQSVYHIYSHVGRDLSTPEPGSPEKPDEHHALIRYIYGHWQVEDVQTERGVYVNQKRVEGVMVLSPNDVINIGDTVFYFAGDYLAYNHTTFRNHDLQIHIDNRSVGSFLKRRLLLKDIKLSIEPGSMVLILGGSGSGKTTFVNAVTGYEKAHAEIRQGDLDVYEDYSRMKYEIGMVPQQELLRGDDTVIMTLTNAAQMRLPEGTPTAERKKRVEEVLALFGLTPVKDELVDKLSGGQRKRLSICVEFISNPSLFVLDEPDSGLDGVMARDLMEQLRKIANQQKIVMVITHTPDRVIDLFDKVIVLAKNSQHTGQLAFYGTIPEARQFFGRDTMEDIILAINPENEGGEGLADHYIEAFRAYRAAEAEKETDANTSTTTTRQEGITATYRPTHTRRPAQVKIYLGKLFRLFIHEHDWVLLPLSAIISLMVAFVVGKSLFANMERLQAGAFALVCVCIWNGFFNSIQVVCRERAIIKREHRAGLHISAYIMAHMLYQALICLLQILISVGIYVWYGIRFPVASIVTGNFLVDFALTLWIITYAADLVALMVSCIVRTTTSAMTVMPFLLIVQLVFAGIIFPFDGGAAELVEKLTISHWGTVAICSIADYNALPSHALFASIYQFRSIPEVQKIVDYIQSSDLRMKMDILCAKQMQNPLYDGTVENILKSWGVILLIGLVAITVGIISLEFIDRDKR